MNKDDDWSLTPAQRAFLFQHHDLLESASSDEDIKRVRALAYSDEFVYLFGDMGIDEAWDRYLTSFGSK